jgi:hypothetical protein
MLFNGVYLAISSQICCSLYQYNSSYCIELNYCIDIIWLSLQRQPGQVDVAHCPAWPLTGTSRLCQTLEGGEAASAAFERF